MSTTLVMGSAQQFTQKISSDMAPHAFVRELLVNSIQAVQAHLAVTGEKEGLVSIDDVEVNLVPKLRFFDTGTGMSREDLLIRLRTVGAEDRTGQNFGLGAKASLVDKSPLGVVYTTIQNHKAYRLMFTGSGDDFNLTVLNPQGVSDLEKYTQPVDLSDPFIADEMRAAGHGTSVVLLGTHADDATALTLRPEGKNSQWCWVELINDRFGHFPTGVNVRLKSYGSTRPITGCAAKASSYIADLPIGTERDYGLHGAYTKTRLTISFPETGEMNFTAHTWILPNEKLNDNGERETVSIARYFQIGGAVRLVSGMEVFTAPKNTDRVAGVWQQRDRVQIHFEADSDITITHDLARKYVSYNGVDSARVQAALCEAYASRHPSALKAVLAAKSSSRNRRAPAGDAAEKFFKGLLTGTLVRSNRGSSTGQPPGARQNISCAGASKKTKNKGGGSSGLSGKAKRLRKKLAGKGSGTSTGIVLGRGTGATARLVSEEFIKAPAVNWVNHKDHPIDPTLGQNTAGYYISGSNTLVLNGAYTGYQNLYNMCVPVVIAGGFEGAADKTGDNVEYYYTKNMINTVLGAQHACNGDTDKLTTVLNSGGLDAAGANIIWAYEKVASIANGLRAGLLKTS